MEEPVKIEEFEPPAVRGGYTILSCIFGSVSFILPALAERVWPIFPGMIGLLALVLGFVGIGQVLQEEKRGLVLAVIGIVLGAIAVARLIIASGWLGA